MADYGLPPRTHHTRLTQIKGAARGVGTFLANNLGLVLFGLDLLYSRYEKRKAAKAAREAAADAATISTTVVPTDAARNLPVVVGRAVVDGISAYVASGQRIPWLPRLAAETSDGTALGRLLYYTTDGRARSPDNDGYRFTLLLLQDMLARHDVAELRHVTVDGEDIDTHPAYPIVVELGAAGTASDLATRFDAGHGVAGNGLGERTAAANFPLGGFATAVCWNDVLHEPAYRRVPRLRYQLLGATMPGVDETAGAYSEGTAAHSNLAPLVLLWAYRAAWGLDGGATQPLLKSVHGALAAAQTVMQGRGGLDDEAYPPILNSIEGTSYATYADAFADRGYISYNTLKRTRTDLRSLPDMDGWETGWPSPTGGGAGRGDRFPRVNAAYGSRMVGVDDQTWTIKRAEANGALFPADNRADLFLEILQTMPFASFARQLASGERELRWPDLAGAAPAADYTLGEGDVIGFSVGPPADPPTNVRIDYNDSAQDGVADTLTLFAEERAGASSNAADYFAARFGRRNTLRLNAPLVDNPYAAAHIGWCALMERLAQPVAIDRNCAAGCSDVGDLLLLHVPSRNVSVKVLVVSARLDLAAFTQSIGGIEVTDHMAAWPVIRRRGAEEPEEEPVRPDALPPTICATWDDERRVAVVDFDCSEDAQGDVVVQPRFPAGCDADRLFRIGDGTAVPLPIYGPGDATYAVTGTTAQIVYDPDNHELDIADATPPGAYPIGVTGTVGANSATCRFTLTVEAAASSFAVTIECSPVGVVTCSHEGGVWRVRLPRGQRRFSLRARLRDLTGGGLPASATVAFSTDAGRRRFQTVQRAADGTIVSAWDVFDEFADFTRNLEAVIGSDVQAGGERRTNQIVATRPKG